MNTTVTQQEDQFILTLSGELDTAASRLVEQEIAPVYSHDDCNIIIDCKDLTYISSSGLRILLSLYKLTRRSGRKAILTHINDAVRDVFVLSGFMQLFTVED